MQCGPPDAGCQELRLSFQKLLLLLVRQVEANRLLSQDTCLTCDVNTNQTHNAALAASLSKQQSRCYGAAMALLCVFHLQRRKQSKCLPGSKGGLQHILLSWLFEKQQVTLLNT